MNHYLFPCDIVEMAVHPSTRSVVTIHQYVQYVCVFISLLFYEKLNAVTFFYLIQNVLYNGKGGILTQVSRIMHCTLHIDKHTIKSGIMVDFRIYIDCGEKFYTCTVWFEEEKNPMILNNYICTCN